METNIQKTEERAPELPVVAPRVDIFENDDQVLLIADLPGAAGSELVVRIEDRVLYIEAPTAETGEGKPLVKEFEPVRYRRAFALNQDVDTGNIRADFRDGVLRITLPKPEAQKPRKIDVVEA